MAEIEWSDERETETLVRHYLSEIAEGMYEGARALGVLTLFTIVYVGVLSVLFDSLGVFVPDYALSATIQIPLGMLLLFTSKWWSRTYLIGWFFVSIFVLGMTVFSSGITTPDPVWSNVIFGTLAMYFEIRPESYPW